MARSPMVTIEAEYDLAWTTTTTTNDEDGHHYHLRRTRPKSIAFTRAMSRCYDPPQNITQGRVTGAARGSRPPSFSCEMHLKMKEVKKGLFCFQRFEEPDLASALFLGHLRTNSKSTIRILLLLAGALLRARLARPVPTFCFHQLRQVTVVGIFPYLPLCRDSITGFNPLYLSCLASRA